MTINYGNVAKTASAIDTPKDEVVDKNFRAFLLADGVANSPNSVNPVGFWTIENSFCVNTPQTWTLGLTRSTGGVAEIAVGST